jgi:hypothetical protein
MVISSIYNLFRSPPSHRNSMYFQFIEWKNIDGFDLDQTEHYPGIITTFFFKRQTCIVTEKIIKRIGLIQDGDG